MAPVFLHLSDHLARRFLRTNAALGETDELGAAIGGIGNSFGVAETLEVVHEIDHRGLADLGELGELGHARAAVGDVLSDGPVSRAEVTEAALHKPLADQLADRQRRVAQQGAEVAGAGPGPAGTRTARKS